MANYVDEFAVKVTADDSKFVKQLKKLGKQLQASFSPKNTTNLLEKDFKVLNNAISSMNAGMATWSHTVKDVNKSMTRLMPKFKQLQKGSWAKYGLGDPIKPLKTYIKELEKDLDKYDKSGNKTAWSSTNEKLIKYKKYRRAGLKYLPEDVATIDKYETYGEDFVKKSEQYDSDTRMLARFKESYKRTYGSSTMDALTGRRNTIQDKIDSILEQQGRQRKNHKKITGQENLEKYKKQLADINDEIAIRADHEKTIANFESRVSGYTDEEVKGFEEMKERYDETKKNLENGSKNGGGIKKIFSSIWQKITEMPRMLGRILTRYLGYQVIKNIFGSVQEGIQNLYTWSRYHNQEFSKLLDKSKSLSVALGNAFALVKTYATMWLERIGNNFKEMLIDLMNLLSKAIAFASGQKTYVQANKDIMIRWADNNATTRQLIQGFDKLNIWKGNDNTLPQDMFTEYAFKDYNIQNIGEMIIDFFKGPFWGLLKTAWSVTWETVIKPVIATLFGPEILAAQDSITLLKAMWAKIKVWWNGVTDTDEGDNGEIITRQVEPGFKHALVEWFGSTWEKVKEFFKSLWTEKISPKLQEWWGKFKEWWNSQIDPILDKAADKLREWWLTRKQSTTYEVEDWVYDKTGAVIDIEDTLRQFKRLMPWNWGKENLNASGGVYTTPHFGIVGEASTRANPELITPTSLLDDRLQANNRELLGAMNGMMNNLIGAVNGINMEVKIGDDVIARSASRGNNAYYKMTGRPLIR